LDFGLDVSPDAVVNPISPRREAALRLAATPADVAAVAVTAQDRNLLAWDGRWRPLTRTFFDVADKRLARRGISVQVDMRGPVRLQRVVMAGIDPFGVVRRSVWSTRLRSGEPDLSAIDDPDLRERLGLVLPGDLRPVALARLNRARGFMLGPRGGGRATLIVEEGEVEDADGVRPLATIELVGEADTAWLLPDRALVLHDMAPLKVDRLVQPAAPEQTVPAPVKAAKTALPADIGVEEGADMLIRACVDHWTRNEASALDGRDPEGVHQLRVALRRLRSLFTLFAPIIAPAQLDRFRTEIGWLAGRTGPARDWDVFLSELLPPVRDACPDIVGLGNLAEAAETVRREGYLSLHEAMTAPRYAALLMRLGEALESGSLWSPSPEARLLRGGHLRDYAHHLLDERHSKVRKRGRRFVHLASADRHRVRIAVKKLRYATEFFSSLYPRKRAVAYGRAMAGFQEELGHLNDIATAERLLAILGARPEADEPQRIAIGVVTGWYACVAAELEPRLNAGWKSFLGAPVFWADGRG